MIFWSSIIVIFLISFLLALRSLFTEVGKPKQLTKIQKDLKKEKILFQRD